MKKIAIDCNLIAGSGGISFMLHKIIDNINKEDLNFQLFLFVNRKCNLELIKNAKINIIYLHIPNYFIWEQLLVPLLCFIYKINILYSPGNTAPIFLPKSIVRILTVHDIIYVKNSLFSLRSIYQIFGRFYLRLLVPLVLKKTDHIIAVSHYTKKDIIDYYKMSSDKIIVIYEAGDPNFDIKNKRIDNRSYINKKFNIHLQKKYFICLGAIDPRKNTLKIIKSFLISNLNNDYLLIVTGVNSHLKHVINKNFGYLKNVLLLEYLVKEDLISLFHDAIAFIYPSQDEGFGIPLLDAMLAKIPIISCANGSIPEIALNFPYYVKTDSVNSISLGITYHMNNKIDCHNITESYYHAKKFNWKSNINSFISICNNI